MTPAALRAARSAAQLLCPPGAPTAEAAVRRVLAVQAQDLRAARLALRARTVGLTASAVDRALTEERSLVVAWLGRGTLHLVGRDDHAWLLGLTAPGRLATSRRRLGQEGVSPDDADRAVAIIERALTDDGPLTRRQLAERIAAGGIRTAGQATPHLLALAALRGITVLGPVRAAGQAFALARDWLGAPPRPVDRTCALAELARRYLAGHGPATAADLAAWAGLPLRDARAGLAAIARGLAEGPDGLLTLAGDPDPAPAPRVDSPTRPATPAAERPGGEPTFRVEPPVPWPAFAAQRPTGEPAPGADRSAAEGPAAERSAGPGPAAVPLPPRLLPAFDPYLLGWRDRSFAMRADHARRIHPGGGVIRAVATADGVAVATWTARRRGARLAIDIEPFAPLDPSAADALRAEAHDAARFEGRDLA